MLELILRNKSQINFLSFIKKIIRFLLDSLLNITKIKYFYYKTAIFFATNGIKPPFAVSKLDSCLRWMNQGKPGSQDKPETYLHEDSSLNELFREVLPYLDKDCKILEIGCNTGRALNYLYQRGYTNLTGIDIGYKAIAMANDVFNEMAENSTLIVGNAPKIIKEFDNDEFDLVFCHSVLVNIHPTYNYIFKEMARVSNKMILTLENEGSFMSYPRDFQKLFEKNGLKMVMSKIFSEGCKEFPIPYKEKDVYKNNTIRLYVKDLVNV